VRDRRTLFIKLPLPIRVVPFPYHVGKAFENERLIDRDAVNVIGFSGFLANLLPPVPTTSWGRRCGLVRPKVSASKMWIWPDTIIAMSAAVREVMLTRFDQGRERWKAR
jgi:hypothetical protein